MTFIQQVHKNGRPSDSCVDRGIVRGVLEFGVLIGSARGCFSAGLALGALCLASLCRAMGATCTTLLFVFAVLRSLVMHIL